MKHLIKIESTAHGILGVRHAGRDQQYCEAGELVILEWQPDAKWGLQEAHYTDGDGNVTPIDLKPVKVNGRDVVVFTMPNANITIGGTFKMFVSQDWTEGTNPSKGEVLTVGNNGEPTPISVDELANEIAEGDNNLVDSIDAINPFKGWYANLATLQASHPSPQVGDYAYVKGAISTDPAAIYECTTAGSWSDSGRTADTSNVQTFASNQEVNEVHIVNDLTTGGADDVLSAEQGKVLNETIDYINIASIYENINLDYTFGASKYIDWNSGSFVTPSSPNTFRFYSFKIKQGDTAFLNAHADADVCVIAFSSDGLTWINKVRGAGSSYEYSDYSYTAESDGYIGISIRTYSNSTQSFYTAVLSYSSSNRLVRKDDVVNDLHSFYPSKPLSAEQGSILSSIIGSDDLTALPFTTVDTAYIVGSNGNIASLEGLSYIQTEVSDKKYIIFLGQTKSAAGDMGYSFYTDLEGTQPIGYSYYDIRTGDVNELKVYILEIPQDAKLFRSSVNNNIFGDITPFVFATNRVISKDVDKILGKGDSTDASCMQAFVEKMNEYAVRFGMNNTTFVNPSGYVATVPNVSTAEDMCRLIAALNECNLPAMAASRPNYSVNVIQSNGTTRTITGNSKIRGYQQIEQDYIVYYGKGGSWETPTNANNVALVARKKGDSSLLYGCVMGSSSKADLYSDVKKLFDYLIDLKDGNTPTPLSITGSQAAGFIATNSVSKWTINTIPFSDMAISYSHGTMTPIQPYSITKTMTAIVSSMYFGETDYITVKSFDIPGSTVVQDGDKIRYYDALLIMMLSSDNAMANAIARCCGMKMLAYGI